MKRRSFYWLLALAFILAFAIVGATQAFSQTPSSETPGVPPQPASNALVEALRQGKWPAQVAAHIGSIRPDRYGPQRNDPAEGIPVHAYSPFDERSNREYPCPPGGCEFQKGRVLVKLAEQVKPRRLDEKGAWTEGARLNEVLQAQFITRLTPIFPQARPPKPGEFIVSALGERLPEPDLSRWYRAILRDEDADVRAIAQALSETPGIAWAEPDYLRKPVGDVSRITDHVSRITSPPLPLSLSPQALPGPGTDPLYAQQWHLDAANVPAAWQWLEDEGLPPGGDRDIVVAVIDTGVDYTHPDLAANMWVNALEFGGSPGVDDDGNGYVDDIYGADTVYPDGDPQDDHGHGTHVAGIIAAQANNGEGGVGVAYNVQLMALKAAQYSGVLAASDIAEAIYYAVEKGADVINMSFGGYARSQVEEDALAVAFGQAVLVAAAGNDGKVNLPCPGGRDMYPAAYNWVLGVMASTSGGSRALFSNYDCMPHDSHEYELLAPGVDVWSTLPVENYAAWDGTSMAAPVVSGIAALARTKWSDKDVYSSRFIMGQIAANTSVGTGGVADAYAALTVMPQPELRYLELWLFDTEEQSPDNDDDGIVDAGETIDLAIVIRNHWGKADPVTVTLEAWAEGAVFPDPYVTMITDTVNYGAIGSFNQDDNGLIYDGEGVIVGVRHPFRFTVPITTPNDHVIPFLLTMTCHNGLDPTDTTTYTFQSRFYLIVQRGRELPTIISDDMELTKDYYWLVPDQTLIEAGATVTVTEGTQIQFWSADPDDPYSQNANPFWQVEGNLLVQGTYSGPVEMFPGMMYTGYAVEIRQVDDGHTDLHYARVLNPIIGLTEYDSRRKIISMVDHCYFRQELFRALYRRTEAGYIEDETAPSIRAVTVTHSIFRNLGMELRMLPVLDDLIANIYDSNCLDLRVNVAEGNVLLKNYKLYESQWGDRTYHVSRAESVGYYCQGCDEDYGRTSNQFRNNAILNVWWDPDIDHWMRFDSGSKSRDWSYYLNNNYWGTTSTTLIDAAIFDYNDDFNKPRIIYQPILTTPISTTYPFVVNVVLSTASDPDASIVGAETVTFTVPFNRDMTTTVQPQVSFGPDVPETDYTVHPVDGGWVDPRTWVGTFNITPMTGDGYQLMRIAGAVAADDPWLVTGDDVERFRFEIITSGTEAMNLQASGGEGYVDLMWTQDDFDLLAGFNLYRSTSQDGTYTRINGSIIPPHVRAYQDTDVTPGQPYYYKFTIVKSDMTESGFSNVATATPIDTIPPVISHTPLTEAPAGLPLTVLADVTDNVGVQSVTLYYRATGETTYSSEVMVHTTGNRYSATIEGSLVASPGLEYYIEANDGISTVREGNPGFPYQILVEDRPVVTTVTPDHGPTEGGTLVTISGSNFKNGASVTFGGAVAEDATVVSSSQMTCSTPPHFPETVDVIVTNPDDKSGTLLRGFTYQSAAAQLSLPDTGGEQHAIVQVPVNAANVQGLLAADVTITFNSAVLSSQGASTGNLTPGWSLEANTSTPGQVTLSMASTSPVSGSGTLANLEFEVVGAPGASSTLHFDSVLLNDGAIPAETTDGSFAVNLVYDVSGAVRFWNGGAGMPGVLLTLEGDRVYSGLSQADGTYTVSGAPADDYTLTPSKSDDVNGITSMDGSLVLQHAAGLITLTGHQAAAADVNKSGAITSMDASYILQKAVDLITLPFPGAGVVWDFDPASRSYTNLSSDQTGQDFTTVLLGDVSGNWSAGGQAALSSAAPPVTLSVVEGRVSPSGLATVTLWLDAGDTPVYSLDLALTYDAAAATAVGVGRGLLAGDLALSYNLQRPGEVQAALAGALPISGQGELLALTFQMAEPSRRGTDLVLTRGDVNEGAVQTCLVHGRLGMWQLYLPLVLKGPGEQ